MDKNRAKLHHTVTLKDMILQLLTQNKLYKTEVYTKPVLIDAAQLLYRNTQPP